MNPYENDRKQALVIILIALLVLIASWFLIGRRNGDSPPQPQGGQVEKKGNQ